MSLTECSCFTTAEITSSPTCDMRPLPVKRPLPVRNEVRWKIPAEKCHALMTYSIFSNKREDQNPTPALWETHRCSTETESWLISKTIFRATVDMWWPNMAYIFLILQTYYKHTYTFKKKKNPFRVNIYLFECYTLDLETFTACP